MRWQNWYPLGIFTLFVLGYALVAWIIRWTDRRDRRDWREAQREASALQNYAQGFLPRREKLAAATESCRALQSESGQEASPIAIAECVVEKLLRAEFEIALGDMIVGPPEFERGARERIKLAVERSRTALKYVDELQGQAGNATHDQEAAPRYLSVFRF